MCSFYLICSKIRRESTKFNEIKEIYQELNQHNKEMHEEIIHKIYKSGNEK